MKVRSPLAAAVLASLALGACARGASGGEEQVVATVNGAPITVADLKAESGPDGVVSDPAVLQRIVERKLMAGAAPASKAQGAAQAEAAAERMAEGARAGAYAGQLADARKPPTPEAVQAYMAAHPNSFANRRFIIVEQLELKRSDRPADLRPPIASLEQAQAALDARGGLYQRTIAAVDSASSRPEVVEQLTTMPRGAVFEMGDDRNLVIGRVLDVRPAPFTGPTAQAVASNLIRNIEARQAVQDGVAQLRKRAKIEYEPGYAPKT